MIISMAMNLLHWGSYGYFDGAVDEADASDESAARNFSGDHRRSSVPDQWSMTGVWREEEVARTWSCEGHMRNEDGLKRRNISNGTVRRGGKTRKNEGS